MGSLKDLDAKHGFRDLKFGMPASAIEGLRFLTNGPADSGLEIAIRPNDTLKIGQSNLTHIHYCFYRSHLYSVSFELSNRQEFLSLLEIFNSAYGAPTHSDTALGVVEWESEKVRISANFEPHPELYPELEAEGLFTFDVSMVSLVLAKKMLTDRELDAFNGVADL